MQEASSYFLNIYNFVTFSPKLHKSDIIDLSSRVWIKGASVQDNNVGSFRLILHIIKDSNDFARKLVLFMVDVIQVLSFWNVNSIV